jgi:F-type H+-transporting ATPase subunit alpha
MGQVMNLEAFRDTVGAVIYGDYLAVKEGDLVKSTGRLLEVPSARRCSGRVVDPLGEPLDDGPALEPTSSRRSTSSPRASPTASRCTSRCRRASRRSTR